MSTLGPRPMADKMSGGDYDGDKVLAIWDPEIITNFKPCDPIEYSKVSEEGPCRPDQERKKFEQMKDEAEMVEEGWAEFRRVAVRHTPKGRPGGGMSKVARLELAHRAHADAAASDLSLYGHGSAVWRLADLQYHALDEWRACKTVEEPQDLIKVQQPQYVYSSNEDRNTRLPRLFVGNLLHGTNVAVLREAFREMWPSVVTAWVASSGKFGFVTFKDELERDRAVNAGSMQFGGNKLYLGPDTTASTQKHEKRQRDIEMALEAAEEAGESASIVHGIWKEFQRHRFEVIEKHGASRDSRWESSPDPELDGDESLSDDRLATEVHEEFKAATSEFASITHNVKPADQESKQKDVKRRLTQRLNAKQGQERESYAAAWFGRMREDHDHRMRQWRGVRSGENGQRPEMKLWIDDIFGEEWNALKRRKLPPLMQSFTRHF
eukprot:SAG31_NODE_2712_length_5208_cov_1.414563_4_plen_437_part_00